MSYTAPTYVDTKAQAILALASTIADEDKTLLGDGSVNRALDVLADVLAEQDVQVPQTDAGAILALAQYVGGGGGGGGDFSTATVTIVNNSGGAAFFNAPVVSDEYRMSVTEFGTEDASATCTAVLYMGTALATFNDVVFSVSATGDAEIDAPDILITGDCTLTFAPAN